MLVIGLTGSIGMGKSNVAERLRALGLPVLDADAEVHKLYKGAAVPLIERAFPGTTRDNEVDRTALSRALTAAPARFKELEAIVHPLVHAAEKGFLQQAARSGADMAVLEVPLLFETRRDESVDVVIVVSAPADIQRSRVLARPGMTEAKLAQILLRQMPDGEKRRRADFVVDTGRTIPETLAQVDIIVALLKGRVGRALKAHWS